MKELGPDTEKDVEEDGLEENCWEDFEDEDHEQQNDNGNGNTMDQAWHNFFNCLWNLFENFKSMIHTRIKQCYI